MSNREDLVNKYHAASDPKEKDEILSDLRKMVIDEKVEHGWETLNVYSEIELENDFNDFCKSRGIKAY